MTVLLEAKGLTKCFGDVRALDGLDLVARSGQVTALLGSDGAGKTTFVRAAATRLRPDGGEVYVAGVEACAAAVVLERLGLA
jgi:ABC-2 type transport system ATP-binding protein